jgi:hypothetical protein
VVAFDVLRDDLCAAELADRLQAVMLTAMLLS